MTTSSHNPDQGSPDIDPSEETQVDITLGEGAPEVIPEEAIHEEVLPPEVGARDAANWAKQISTLTVGDAPADAVNRNVDGRRVMSPIQGFGKMWQKTYRVKLNGIDASPEQVISEWKQKFPEFWPENNRFFGPLTGIAPGEVALLNLTMPGRLKLSTGVLVLYADEESFTLMTPQGHMFAGWITFSSFEKDGAPVAQAQVLMRANDPMYEMGLTFGGHAQEDKFWCHTLNSLAQHFGAEGEVETQVLCVDKKRQWSKAGNIWHNAAIRSSIYAMGAPGRVVAQAFKKTP
ncbi:MAG: hypothetical protein H0U16_03490 [Actinobacteria bacterium]|nr:hypothetical protein [Actinomycetota bacterium]